MQQSCKVPGCTEDHRKHYCRNCNNRDSDHFGRECPNLAPPPPPSGCRVQGCNEDHCKHYCRNCNNRDSNHFGRECPNLAPPPPPSGYRVQGSVIIIQTTPWNSSPRPFPPTPTGASKPTCQVTGCREAQTAHYCSLCHDQDSDHFSRECPRRCPPSPPTLPMCRAPDSRNSRKFSKSTATVRTGGCRAAGCTKKHSAHFCRVCRDSDAAHRSSQCPKKFNGGCKARGCTESHSAHFCWVCRDSDAAHMSSQCPKKVKGGCKARGCNKAHSAHYCWVCKDKDSNHVSVACGTRHQAILYHGTLKHHKSSIQQNGLRISKHGTLGAGVYFVTTRKYAEAIARHRSGSNGSYIVVEAVCDLGKIYSAPPEARGFSDWQRNNDSCYHKHGPWANVPSDFREVCIKDSSRVKVTQIHDCT